MEELKTYAEEVARDRSKFDPDALMYITNRLVAATYELNQLYKSAKTVGSTQ